MGIFSHKQMLIHVLLRDLSCNPIILRMLGLTACFSESSNKTYEFIITDDIKCTHQPVNIYLAKNYSYILNDFT